MKSRWPVRILCALLVLWYMRFGFASRRPTSKPRRILVAHNLLLGDTIMVAPLLKKLRARFPGAEIVMTCKPAFVAIFASRPYGVETVAFDPRDVRSFFALFCRRGFDMAYLATDNRFSWLARALDSRWVVAFDGDRPAYKNWLIDEFRKFPDHAMALGDLIAGHLLDGPSPDPYEVSDWPAPPAAPFPKPDRPYVVLHVGASTRLKYWSPENWQGLIAYVEALGMRPVITAGPGEEALIAEIDHERRFVSYRGNLSLPQMWRLLADARLVVCPDTGVGHLARLAGVPVVILFGPGSAVLSGGGEFWRNMVDRKVTIEGFPCRDENVLFRRYVPWAAQCGRTTAQCSSPKCMHALTAEMAISAVDSLLARAAFKPGK
ncbi:MAG: glycosyltransferase family 9 protein [Betaproteobacteria bacterium]